MSKLTDAQKAVAKIEAHRDELEQRMAAAEADAIALAGQRAAIEERAFGAGDTAAEASWVTLGTAIDKNAATLRGIARSIETAERELGPAIETRDAAQLVADGVRLRELEPQIAKIEAQASPLRAERSAIVSRQTGAAQAQARDRNVREQRIEAAHLRVTQLQEAQ